MRKQEIWFSRLRVQYKKRGNKKKLQEKVLSMPMVGKGFEALELPTFDFTRKRIEVSLDAHELEVIGIQAVTFLGYTTYEV